MTPPRDSPNSSEPAAVASTRSLEAKNSSVLKTTMSIQACGLDRAMEDFKREIRIIHGPLFFLQVNV